jgi:serine/threonine protein kinase
VRVGLHKPTGRKVAIKIYEKTKLTEPQRKKSVKREIRLMNRIKHINVARLYEAFDNSQQVFLVMEYVTGGSLHAFLKSKPNR